VVERELAHGGDRRKVRRRDEGLPLFVPWIGCDDGLRVRPHVDRRYRHHERVVVHGEHGLLVGLALG
jgi:hypothetical protein